MVTSISQPCILLIAPSLSYRISAYIKAAFNLHLDLKIASPSQHSFIHEVANGIHIDMDDPEAAIQLITKEAMQVTFRAVIATDDATVELAALVAQALKLPHTSIETARITRRKDLARACLKDAGVPVPRFRLINLKEDVEKQSSGFPFPCVIKPISMSASRGVIRVNNMEQLVIASQRVVKITAELKNPIERDSAILEEYISGKEFALDGIMNQGNLATIALFDKPDLMEGPYFEETYYITPSRLSSSLQKKLINTVAKACKAYQLCDGPIHAEARLYKNEFWMLEVAARTIGGDCARLLDICTDHTLEEIVLSAAIGNSAKLELDSVKGGAGVLMIPIPCSGIVRKIEGIEQAKSISDIVEVSIRITEGHEVTSLPEGSSYLGFIYAKSATPAAAEVALRQAYSKLNIKIAPMWRIQGNPAKT